MGCESNWMLNFFWSERYDTCDDWSWISWDTVISEVPSDGTFRLICDARCFYERNKYFEENQRAKLHEEVQSLKLPGGRFGFTRLPRYETKQKDLQNGISI